MLNISLIIYNPWCKTQKILISKNFKISKNKSLEINLYKSRHVISFEFDIRCNCDHAGSRLMIGLLGFDFEINFYDNGHLS